MQKVPHPDIGSFDAVNMSISEMIIWMPDLSKRTVKSLVQGEFFKMYNMINMEMLKSHTEGSSEENSLELIDLEHIDLRDMMEKYFDHLMKLFNSYHHLPLMMQSNLKERNPYIALAENYAEILKSLFGEGAKELDNLHETIMCLYDSLMYAFDYYDYNYTLYGGEDDYEYYSDYSEFDHDKQHMKDDGLKEYYIDEEMKNQAEAHASRNHFEDVSKRMINASKRIISSPYLKEAMTAVVEDLSEEFMNIDMEEGFEKIKQMMINARARVREMPIEEIQLSFEKLATEMEENLLAGEDPKIQNMVHSIMASVMNNSFWIQFDEMFVGGMEMMEKSAVDMAVKNNLLSEGCELEAYPLMCCAETRMNQALEMIEHMADDMEVGNLDHCADIFRNMKQEIKGMVPEMMQMTDALNEKHLISCMLDSELMNKTSSLQETLKSMEVEFIYENNLDSLLDNSLDTVKSVRFGCPNPP